MTPADFGLPEAPWYGIREEGFAFWHRSLVLGHLLRDAKEAVTEAKKAGRFEIAAFGDSTGASIVGNVVTVVVEVTVRKMDE